MALDLRIVSIGAIESNPFWNDQGDARPGHATTSLVRTDEATILVDPSLPPDVLAPRLLERTGLGPNDVTHVFLTSFRPTGRRGLALFPNAAWLLFEREREAIGVTLVEKFQEAQAAGDEELANVLRQEVELLRSVKAAPDSIAPGVDLFPLPGVTPGLCGLLLIENARTTLIAGDAVATVDHLGAGRVMTPCHDIEAAQESFREAVEIADLIVPGRDNIVPGPGRSLG